MEEERTVVADNAGYFVEIKTKEGWEYRSAATFDQARDIADKAIAEGCEIVDVWSDTDDGQPGHVEISLFSWQK